MELKNNAIHFSIEHNSLWNVRCLTVYRWMSGAGCGCRPGKQVCDSVSDRPGRPMRHPGGGYHEGGVHAMSNAQQKEFL